jgi:hypothetical protein
MALGRVPTTPAVQSLLAHLGASRVAARLSDSAADDEQAGTLVSEPTMARLSRFTVALNFTQTCQVGNKAAD